MKHGHQICLAQPEVSPSEHEVKYLLQVRRNRPVLHEHYGFQLRVISLLVLKYADELADLAGYLVPVLYPIISPSLLFANPLRILHLRVHVVTTAADLLDDNLIDEAVEDVDDAGALSAEFLLLLLEKVSTQVDKEHLETEHAELYYKVVDILEQHYDQEDQGTILRIFEGTKIYLFRFVYLDVDEFLPCVDEFKDLGVLGEAELIINS